MKSVIKKSLAVVLTFAMLLSMLAMSGFAAPAVADKNDNEPCAHNNATTEVVAAGCGSWGGTWHFCQTEGCGDYWVTDLVEPTEDHDYEDETEPATCTTPMYIKRVCKNCGHIVDRKAEGKPLDHHYVTIVDKKEDCTNPGEWTQKCDRVNPDGTVCGHLNPDNKDASDLPAWDHAHKLNEVSYKAPTCTDRGWVIVTCTNEGCDQDFGDAENKIYIAATGHHVVSTEVNACTTTGKQTVYYCDNAITDDHGHVQYDAEGEAIICGLLFNSNSANDPREDGKTLNDVLNGELTHTWANVAAGETITVTPAGTTPAVTEPAYFAGNCDPENYQAGWQWKRCSVCGAEKKFGLTIFDENGEEVPVEVHHLDYTVLETVAARCANTLTGGVFTKGYQLVKCNVCETEFKTNWREPTHTFSNAGTSSVVLTPVYAAKNNVTDLYDRNDKGEIIFYNTETEIPANHTAVIWFIQQVKACGQNGIYIHGCEICGFVEMDIHLSSHTEITETQWTALGMTGTYDDAKTAMKVAATCTTGAYDRAFCIVCYNELLAAGGNTDDAWYKITSSETAPLGHLGADGNRLALVNGKPVGVIVNEKAPTCTEPGNGSYEKCYDPTCALYANVSSVPAAKVIDATGHSWSEEEAYRVFVPATCTWGSGYVPGCKNADCGIGKHEDPAFASFSIKELSIAGTWDDAVNPLAHQMNEVAGSAVQATCAQNGKLADKLCALCGKTEYGAPVLQLNADWQTRVIAPDCDDNGYTETYCANCEANGTTVHASTQSNLTVATGVHKIKDADYTWDATINDYRVDLTNATPATGADAHANPKDGSCGNPFQYHVNNYVCEGCDEVMEFTVALVHTSNNVSSCTQAELCTACGTTLRAAAADHAWVLSTDATKTFAPDCTTNGQEYYECSVCDADKYEKYEAEVPAQGTTPAVPEKNAHLKALGHAPEEGKTPDCLNGVKCTRCEDLALQPTGHKDAEGNPIVGVPVSATCQTNAYTKYTCANENCPENGYWEVETPNSTVPHSYKTITAVTRSANCLLFGVTVKVCEYCDEAAYGENFVGALGHDLEDKVNPNSCEEDGLKFTVCTRTGCGQAHADDVDHNGKKAYVETEVLPAHGHKHLDPILDENDAPVLDEDGNPTYTETIFFFTCTDEALKAAGTLTCVNADCDALGEGTDDKTYKYENAHDYSKTLSTATCQQPGLEYYYCRTCLEKHILGEVPVQEHNLVAVDSLSKKPTITEDGYIYYECSWKCGAHSTVVDPALPGIHISGSIANVFAIDGVDFSKTIVNGGLIAYTVKMTAAEELLYSVTMSLQFDASKLEYVGYTIPEGGNFFGEGTTFAGSADGSNIVTVYAFNQNSVDKQVMNATLAGEQEFVTVYFYVKGDVLDDTISTSTVTTGISIVENSIAIFDIDEDAPAKIEVAQAANVTVKKLGDVNCDGVINSNDALAVRKAVLSNSYDAQADINVDGVVDGDDLALVMQYIINTLDYSDLFAL